MNRKIAHSGWILLTATMFIAGFNFHTLYADAYIDPSAVTYVIQAVAAVVIALGAALTIFRHKIFAFFKKGKGEEEKKEIHFTEDDSAAEASAPETSDEEAK